jgi:site-specific DNA-methyltransferase (adenine-specific)
MTPPNEIPFSSVDLGERGRTEYLRIEELADSIRDNGLIQPIVLVPLYYETMPSPTIKVYGLDAGGRRYHALKLLGTTTLYHAATSEPGRPGYVLKGEAFSTPLQRLMTEIAENLDRDDPDWRDQTRLIVKAWRMSQAQAHAEGEEILMRDFGAMLGCGYSNLQAAVAIHDDLIANPDRYKDCYGIRAAYTKLLKVNLVEVTKVQAAKSLEQAPTLAEKPDVSVQFEPEPEGLAVAKPTVIPLTSAFINCNSLDYMAGLPGPTFDHIVTDPDYGVSVERLEAGVGGAAAGVAQTNIEDSLHDMRRFIRESARVIKDQGFLVFWYDLDHHEKLQTACQRAGFMVQRWPLIWHKSDYRSNAAPAHNFCKNIEYAMICRKPNAVLSRAQTSSVFNCPTGTITRDLGHPFAKPLDLSKWIYSAISIKGQVVYDPFLGSGAISIAALDFGLKPVGSEIDAGRYANALMNLQGAYKKLLGGNVTFS